MSDRTVSIKAVQEGDYQVVIFDNGSGVMRSWTFECPEKKYDRHTVITWLAERWVEDRRPPCFCVDCPDCVACYLHILQFRKVLEQSEGDDFLHFVHRLRHRLPN